MRLSPFSFLLAVIVGAAALGDEVVRLPTVMPAGEPYPGVLTSHPETVIKLEPTVEPEDENIWDRPIDARNGFFQYLNFDTTYLADGRGPECFGDTEIEIRGTFVLPLPSKRHPLLITPGYAVHFLDGPRVSDVPARLYDTYVQFRWLHKLSPRWSADLSVTPGVFSDFEQSSDEALRITGHFGAMWDWTPMAKIALGVAYLDREDLRILPFAGIIWEPTPDLKLELMVPRPMIAKRIYWTGELGEEVQDWLYLAGELGGGSWAIRRESGVNDVLTYRDLRVILGLERRVLFGVDYRLEVAYVFARKVEYESPTPSFTPSGTVMVRLCHMSML
ncbi:MAG: DUF6268 family outer membrane beta-barrel protein [Planctomycetia bacterium]|nr:DUF6268 family outer membrane beta-barrel protein [Planctomycetia bacterium]